jgi:hypothetical protein
LAYRIDSTGVLELVTLNFLQSNGYWFPGIQSPIELIAAFPIEKADESQIVVAEQESKRCYATVSLPLTSVVAPSRIVLRFPVRPTCIGT